MNYPPHGEAAPLLAQPIAADCNLRSDARHLLGADMTARAFFELLIERELYVDAVRFLALALPRRLAVWWGCLCVWQTARGESSPEVSAALQAVVRWVLDPSEENRRAAEGPGQPGDFETAASCLAMAAHWSGGSMLPLGLPVVPPAEILTGKLIGGAVLLAAFQHGANDALLLFRQFLSIGKDVARGDHLWTELDLSTLEVPADQDGEVRVREELEASPIASRAIMAPASVSVAPAMENAPLLAS